MSIQENYTKKAKQAGNALERQLKRTYDLKAFNNWIKSVLISITTKDMCRKVEKGLDLRRGNIQNKLLHVLDLGCGRGQDIKKWKLARVNYMVAMDFSDECIKKYEERWQDMDQPYHLTTLVQDFTSKELYQQIEHSYYDIVSAQLCFHYMFSTKNNLIAGLTSALSNLLQDGMFIATIPDSYTILKKIKTKGVVQEDGSIVHSNKYFSIRMEKTSFQNHFGNQYGFYLEEAIGEKFPSGEIKYTNEWLVSLDALQQILALHGVCIETRMNFLEFYVKYREQYRDLFSKFHLSYDSGKHMDPELWEIAHLYQVIICRKTTKGRKISDYDLKARQQSIIKEVKPIYRQQSGRGRGRNNQGYLERNDFSRSREKPYDNYRGKDRNYQK